MAPTSYLHRRCALALVVAAFTTKTAVADYDPIAGYTPVSDVVPHSLLDLDMLEIETNVDLLTEDGMAAAYKRYAEGKNSVKTDEIRTLRGFSLDAQEKLTGEWLFDIYEDYWGEPDYADIFTSAACNGTDDFEGAEIVTRAEACLKGAQYQNLWMYVIHEMEDAIADCEVGDLSANDGGPHAWDEAWAFYAGSKEGTEGTGEGIMLYALAENRCEDFATCTGDDDGDAISGTSQINFDALELFQEGQTQLLSGDCDGAYETKDKIIDLMTVPVLQGMLRYFYLADPEAGVSGDKEASELWAFAAAVLPRIHECDPTVADLVRANTEITSTDAPMSGGYVFLKEQVQSVYSCMGISCSQVGGFVAGESTVEYYEDFGPCSDSDDGDNKLLVGLLVAGAVVLLGICGGCFYRKRRSSQKSKAAMEADLGGFGGPKPATL